VHCWLWRCVRWPSSGKIANCRNRRVALPESRRSESGVSHGLLRAYVRARYDLTVTGWLKSVVDRVWRWIRRKPRRVDIVISPATATIRVETGASGYVTFNLDTTQTVQEQLKRLAEFVNNRSKESNFVQQNLIELGRETRQMRGIGDLFGVGDDDDLTDEGVFHGGVKEKIGDVCAGC
jgi:hypothetical protein